MADSPEAQQAADKITALLMADPVMGPILRAQAAKQPFDSNAADARLKAIGVSLPPGMWISGGKVQHENMTVDNIGKAIKIVIPALIGVYGAKSLANGNAPAGTTPSTPPQGPPSPSSPGGSLWERLAGPLLSAGTQIGSTIIQTKANSDALKTQQEATDKALALQKEMFDQHRADEAPYRQIGTGALGLLGQGMGIDMTPQPAAPTAGASAQDAANRTANTAANTPGALQSLGPPPQMSMPTNPALGNEPMVRIYSPSGSVGQVPQSKLQAALAAGGRMA